MSSFEEYKFNPGAVGFYDLQDPVVEFPDELKIIDSALIHQEEIFGGVDLILHRNGKYILSLAESLAQTANTSATSPNRIVNTIATASIFLSQKHLNGDVYAEYPSADTFGGVTNDRSDIIPPNIANLLYSPSGTADLFCQSFVALKDDSVNMQTEKYYNFWKNCAFEAIGRIERELKND